jgi:hypothetical protein
MVAWVVSVMLAMLIAGMALKIGFVEALRG